MKTILAILLSLSLIGCGSLSRLPDEDGKPETAIEQVRDALAAPETALLCQTADAVTTTIALERGAVEKNPIMGKIITKFGYFGMFAVKAAIVYYAFHHFNKTSETERVIMAGLNGVTCAVAANNAALAKSLRLLPAKP